MVCYDHLKWLPRILSLVSRHSNLPALLSYFFQGVFASVCRSEVAGKHHELCQLARFLDNNRCKDLYSSVSELLNTV
jgi:hypothetical protein